VREGCHHAMGVGLVIADILPPEVVAVEAFEDPPGIELFPEEAVLLARAVDKRRHEFATGRHCARAALARLGVPPAPLLPGPRGAPRWPAGVVGSITHCDGYRAAAVARDRNVVTLGLDAEPADPLPDGVMRLVFDVGERAWIRELGAARPEVCWDRLLFSAKESVYKAWFPLAGRWLGFAEASVTVDPDAATFAAALLVPGPAVGGRTLTGFAGRWMIARGLVITTIAVPA
jgi:enterobactin synthetase component D / holo-[acyl-carrier protein] synthase